MGFITRESMQRFIARKYKRRKFWNSVICGLLGLAAVVALVPLFGVLSYTVMKGAPGLSLDFFTKLPMPVGETGGGMANALLGTALLMLLACLGGVPWGISIGVFLSEYPRAKLATLVRFCVDMLGSVPSIIIGLFIYVIVVIPMQRFSILAGALTLAILMVPTIARSTEEFLKLVPSHIREAGLALGLPRWKVILRIVLQGSIRSISTGVVLAIARVGGETAPLLFTAFNNRVWQQGIDQPTASLPVQIYTYAISPFDDWHAQAWSGALVLVGFVLWINLSMRFILRRG